jgi:uroporphyrinogen-III synthase
MSTITLAQAISSIAPAGSSFYMTDNTNYSTLVWTSPNTTKPTEAAAQAALAKLIAEEPLLACTNEAKRLLAASDWSVLPDVNISNKAEFETYRAQLRELMFNPVAAPVFPTEPQPNWI